MFLLQAIILCSSVAFTLEGNVPSLGRSQNDDWVPANLPWIVSLGERQDGQHHHICPGALAVIDNARAGRLVLTTAKCAGWINFRARAQAMLQGGRTVNIVNEQWNEQNIGPARAAVETALGMLKHSDIGVIALEEQFPDRTISFVMRRNYYPTGSAMIASWRNLRAGRYAIVEKEVAFVDPVSCEAALHRAINGTLEFDFFRGLIKEAAVLCVSGATKAETGTPLFVTGSSGPRILGMAVHPMDEYMAFINLHNEFHKGIISVLVERLIQQMNATNE